MAGIETKVAASQAQPAAAMVTKKIATASSSNNNEVEFAKCECCGLTEECTEAYIRRVRDRFNGRWICGLCSEAVKEEVMRSPERRIGNEEALNRHMSFCNNFRKSLTNPPTSPNPTEELIDAVKQLLLRCLDSPRSRNKPVMVRSKSCFSALEG